ncbi:MAG: hypothetical protein EXS18_06000 [Verrucomicrobiae bacterium]|nr:hypothetical protein [Verrucomicrobiae bacterium]
MADVQFLIGQLPIYFLDGVPEIRPSRQFLGLPKPEDGINVSTDRTRLWWISKTELQCRSTV